MKPRPRLGALAERLGILPSYLGVSGRGRRFTSDATRVALLAAMGFDASTEAAASRALRDLERTDEERPLAPVRVVRPGDPGAARVPVKLPAELEGKLAWSLELRTEEGGTTRSEGSLGAGRSRRAAALPLPARLPPGYHVIRLRVEASRARCEAEQTLIAAPASCLTPAEKLGPRRAFGLWSNLYTVRSQRNWGAGDLTDLARLSELAGAEGAAFIGINPLHAVWNRGGGISPYAPVSRLYRSPLYLDVEAVPELGESPAARARIASPGFQQTLSRLRASDRVDYETVASLKLAVLGLLHRTFAERHRGRDTERGRVYSRYLEREAEALRDFATFVALAGHFSADRRGETDWRSWPAPYRDPRSASIRRFRREHAEAVDLHCFVQFELDRQLGASAGVARSAGLPVGLYGDLAIGTASSGSDPWAFPRLFAGGASVGAPPDDFAAAGQDWGFPPLDPRRLELEAYAYWIRLLRACFEHVGALRIDHVMGLFRLFWIPAGRPATEGAYVRYPSRDLLGILALESRRSGSLVVGEDLGTVPQGLRAALARWGILSSRVLYFERSRRGTFRPAERYSKRVLASANTHDLAPLAGFVAGRDLALRRRAGQIPTDDALREAQRDRRGACRALVRRLAREGLVPSGDVTSGVAPGELLPAVIAFLCRTPAPLVAIALDDLVGETEPLNLPGVAQRVHPSWTRRMKHWLEGLADHPVLRAGLAAVPRGRILGSKPSGGRR